MEKSNRANRFSTEVRARAVRMILEHEHEYANLIHKWRRDPKFALDREIVEVEVTDPQAWFADTLARIQDYKINRVDELLPWKNAL